MKILITGGAGYIGLVVAQQLLNKGYQVRVLDSLIFGGHSLLGLIGQPHFEFIKADIRDDQVVQKSLDDVSAIIHLAALGGKLCESYPDEAIEVNIKSTQRLADACVKRGIMKLIFSSTCSNYGVSKNNELLTEDSPLKPVSVYATTKVNAESYLLSLASDSLQMIVLRFATVFGIALAIRFDLLLHEFVREAAVKNTISIYGAKSLRPLVHVTDVARAIILALEADNLPQKDIFNVGDENMNITKQELAERVQKYYPDARIISFDSKEDPRNYGVFFRKIRQMLNYKTTKMIEDGIKELRNVLDVKLIDPYGSEFNQVPSQYFASSQNRENHE